MKKNKDKIFNLILSVLPFACILLIWGISANSVGNDKLLPSVKETFRKFFFLFTYSEFYSALLGTLLRSVIAFVCSFAIAFGLALLCMRFNKANVVISPVIAILRALPTIAVVLMLLVWTNSLVAPVIVTMIVVLPTTFTSVKTALLAVDKEQLEMCRLFNVERKKILSKVYIPQIMPDMMVAVGTGLSLNLKLMVAAEVIAFTSDSLGQYLSLSKTYDATATMMALVVCILFIGLFIELIFSALSKRAGRWK